MNDKIEESENDPWEEFNIQCAEIIKTLAEKIEEEILKTCAKRSKKSGKNLEKLNYE